MLLICKLWKLIITVQFAFCAVFLYFFFANLQGRLELHDHSPFDISKWNSQIRLILGLYEQQHVKTNKITCEPIWDFTGRTGYFAGFVVLWLIIL